MRYILFAVTLLSDSIILIMSDFQLILNHFSLKINVGLCIIFYIISLLYTFATPITLTAMTLERCVAICMPLHHAVLHTEHSALYPNYSQPQLCTLHCCSVHCFLHQPPIAFILNTGNVPWICLSLSNGRIMLN